ncbi:hypothetical protein MHYP_G00130890 [Metynnis hypsauchen]
MNNKYQSPKDLTCSCLDIQRAETAPMPKKLYSHQKAEDWNSAPDPLGSQRAGSNGRSAQVGVQGRGAIKYQQRVTHAPQTAAIVSFAARPPHFRGDESPTHRNRERERARKAPNMNEFTPNLQPNLQITAFQASVKRTFTLSSQ